MVIASFSRHRDVIKHFGGPTALAQRLGLDDGVNAPTTLKWHARGIPPRYWTDLGDLLAADGIKMPGAHWRGLKRDEVKPRARA